MKQDPALTALKLYLGALAKQWRTSGRDATVAAYHDGYYRWMELGGDGYLDDESQLPPNLMPRAHFQNADVEPLPELKPIAESQSPPERVPADFFADDDTYEEEEENEVPPAPREDTGASRGQRRHARAKTLFQPPPKPQKPVNKYQRRNTDS